MVGIMNFDKESLEALIKLEVAGIHVEKSTDDSIWFSVPKGTKTNPLVTSTNFISIFKNTINAIIFNSIGDEKLSYEEYLKEYGDSTHFYVNVRDEIWDEEKQRKRLDEIKAEIAKYKEV